MTTAVAHQLVSAVQRAGSRRTDVDEFFAEVSEELSAVVPFDGSMWFGVDPATLLASAPARIHNMDSTYCWPFWNSEFHENDPGLFRDLARQTVPVMGLQLAMDHRPMRSPRYRQFVQPQGYDDEARVVFRTGTTSWAVAALYREKGRPAFQESDLDVLAGISRAVGVALRERNLPQATASEPLSAPGVMLFDREAALVSANQEARAWLTHIYGPEVDECCSWTEMLATCTTSERLLPYPMIQSLTAHARAVALGYEDGPARLRFRDRGGRWVVMHASCLDGTDAAGPVAVVVEPAKSAEIAPIIVEAYGLSARERDVVRGIARGMSTPEIAEELFLSGHTVRDYIKSVFDKVGVGSRGELIAKLFAEHYSDALHEAAVTVG